MELRFTDVARAQMMLEGVHRLEVEAIVAFPESVVPGDVLVRYDGWVADREISVFIVADSEPPVVMLVRAR